MRHAKLLPFFAIVVLLIGCDHAAKAAAVSILERSAPIEFLRGVVRFELAYNPGAFLSLGAGLPPTVRSLLFGFAVPALVIAASIAFLRGPALGRPALVALALLAGGGLANGLDRLLHRGYVTDFVSLGIGDLRTGIFNVADVAVIAGVAVMVLLGSRGSSEPAEPESS
jgi:signal peptidase II